MKVLFWLLKRVCDQSQTKNANNKIINAKQ
jgi:hypothetical protein